MHGYGNYGIEACYSRCRSEGALDQKPREISGTVEFPAVYQFPDYTTVFKSGVDFTGCGCRGAVSCQYLPGGGTAGAGPYVDSDIIIAFIAQPVEAVASAVAQQAVNRQKILPNGAGHTPNARK